MVNFIKNLFCKPEIANVNMDVVETKSSTRKKVSVEEIEWAKSIVSVGTKDNLKDYHRALYILNKYGIQKHRKNVKGARPLVEKYRNMSMEELEKIILSNDSSLTQKKAAIRSVYTLGYKASKEIK